MSTQCENSLDRYREEKRKENNRTINKKRPNVVGSGILTFAIAIFFIIKKELPTTLAILALVFVFFVFLAGWKFYCLYIRNQSSYYDDVILSEERCFNHSDEGFRFEMSEAITKVIMALKYADFHGESFFVGVYATRVGDINPAKLSGSIESDWFGKSQRQIQCEIGAMLAKANALYFPCAVKIGSSEKEIKLFYEDEQIEVKIGEDGQSPISVSLNGSVSSLSCRLKAAL